eukprot:RCo035319
MKVARRRVSIRKLAIEALRILEVQAMLGKTELLLDVAANVPSVVLCDPLLLQRILMNLVGNALKFSKEGRVTLSVFWDAASAKMSVVVTDTGIGMTSDE